MKLSDFDFTVPTELIAQEPAEKRDNCDLLVVEPNKELVHTKFYNIINYLLPNDLIIFNNSKVINAKLTLNKADKKIELYLNKQIKPNYWHGFAKPSKKLNKGDQFDFDGNKVIISKKLGMGQIEVQFDLDNISVLQFLEKFPQIKKYKDV
jgi:S-adenosylmethionine:tRNA ribosyltransferase-isomerase